MAEDVAQVDPNLAVRDGTGKIDSVRYCAVNNIDIGNTGIIGESETQRVLDRQ